MGQAQVSWRNIPISLIDLVGGDFEHNRLISEVD